MPRILDVEPPKGYVKLAASTDVWLSINMYQLTVCLLSISSVIFSLRPALNAENCLVGTFWKGKKGALLVLQSVFRIILLRHCETRGLVPIEVEALNAWRI